MENNLLVEPIPDVQNPDLIPGICHYSSWVAALLLVGMTGLIATTVIGRYIFKQPITGADEMLSLALLGLAFLAFGEVEIQGRHIRVTILTDLFPDKVNLYLNVASGILSIGAVALMAWKALFLTHNFWVSKTASLVMGIPLFIIVLAMVWGSVISVLAFGFNIVRNPKTNILKSLESIPWLVLAIAIPIFLISIPFWIKLVPWTLTKLEAGLIGLSLMFVLLFMGPSVGTVMLFVGYLGTSYIAGLNAGLSVLVQVSYSTATSYGWVVLPLFMFMGNMVFGAGLGTDIYRTAHAWMGHLPGGLAMATIGGCAGFAAACGDSLSTAITLCRISLPEMRRYNYDIALATGALAAGGTLGILIPPSLGFIIYGMLTEQSIGALFVAGIIPGICLASLFNIMIYLRVRKNLTLGPPSEKTPWLERFRALKDTVGILSLFVLVIGGIYAGAFTATEGAGIGAFGAFIAAILKRRFSIKGFIDAIQSATLMNGSIFFILIGAMVLSHFVTVCNIPLAISDFISTLGLNRWIIFAIIMLFYIILGCIMNIMPAVIITLPMIFPTIQALGFDPIWFGVMMVINMEMGQITPPVGINVYAICSVVQDVSMSTVFRGVMPFFLMMLLMMFVLVLVPELATFLPGLFFGP
jgi:tripartite ATP-independent transporter DctM subunit